MWHEIICLFFICHLFFMFGECKWQEFNEVILLWLRLSCRVRLTLIPTAKQITFAFPTLMHFAPEILAKILGGTVILLSAFLCRLCPGDRTAWKKKKNNETKESRWFIRGIRRWQKLPQPRSATAQSSSEIFHLPQHKTGQAADTAAAQFWGVLCSKYPQSRSKHPSASADLDCWAHQPGKVQKCRIYGRISAFMLSWTQQK